MKTPQNVVSDTIKDLTIKALDEKVITLSKALSEALKRIEEKNVEIQRLKSSGASLEVAIYLSDEEMLTENQLRMLKETALTRELTLDEIKKFDLLVKNKRLAQDRPTTIDGGLKNLSKTELLQIVASKKKEEQQ